MNKLKNMTIACENTEEAKEYWYLEELGSKPIVQADKELDIYEIPSLTIGNIVVLKVEESTTPKEFLKILKHNGIEAIVLENSVDIFDEDIYCFDDEMSLVDYVLKQNKPFTFIEVTAEVLHDLWEEDVEKRNKIEQLWKVSGDDKILIQAVRDKM